jgi:hypothetical protein
MLYPRSENTAHSVDDIARYIEVTGVRYNQNMQGYDKKSSYFLGRHCL